MRIRHLIPWKKPEVVRGGYEHPFPSLRTELNRLFEDFFGGSDLDVAPMAGWPEAAITPRVNIREDDSTVEVTAEIPGVAEKDLEVLVEGDTLTIKGEKKHESEEKGKDTYRSERVYGAFQRSIALPAEVVAEKAEASYKKGVLAILLPKSEKAMAERRKIAVKAE